MDKQLYKLFKQKLRFTKCHDPICFDRFEVVKVPGSVCFYDYYVFDTKVCFVDVYFTSKSIFKFLYKNGVFNHV